MLIKTFKFLSEEKTTNTRSFIKSGNSYIVDVTKDHVHFPLSFSVLGNTIVARYVDLMIKKYEIPRDEVSKRVKIKVTSVTETNGEDYVVYVCMFCGINFSGGLTTKEYLETQVDESLVSDDATSVTYRVSGEIIVNAPVEATYPMSSMNGLDTLKIILASYDRYGNPYKEYVMNYKTAGSTTDNRFTLVQLPEDYNEGNNRYRTVVVPNRGKLFCYLDSSSFANIKEVYENNGISNIQKYSTKKISNISNDKYNVLTIDGRNYLDLKTLTIQQGNDTTRVYGKLRIYRAQKIVNDSIAPYPNSVSAYVRMYNITEGGYREYNGDDYDLSNVKSTMVASGEDFSFEVSHLFPYIEFRTTEFPDDDNTNIDNPKNYSFIYKVNTDFPEESVNKDVDLYNIEEITSDYSFTVNIDAPPTITNGSIPCEVLCYFGDNYESTFRKKDIVLQQASLSSTRYTCVVNGEPLPAYSRIVIRSTGAYENLYISNRYVVGQSVSTSQGRSTINVLNDMETITLYPVTPYRLKFQACYGKDVMISYTNMHSVQEEMYINDLESVSNALTFDKVFKFVDTPKPVIYPLAGTPVFVYAVSRLDSDIHYETQASYNNTEYYKKEYVVNSVKYTAQFVLENNYDKALSTLTYSPTIKNYNVSFNSLDDNSLVPISTNVMACGVIDVNDRYNIKDTNVEDINTPIGKIHKAYFESGTTGVAKNVVTLSVFPVIYNDNEGVHEVKNTYDIYDVQYYQALKVTFNTEHHLKQNEENEFIAFASAIFNKNITSFDEAYALLNDGEVNGKLSVSNYYIVIPKNKAPYYRWNTINKNAVNSGDMIFTVINNDNDTSLNLNLTISISNTDAAGDNAIVNDCFHLYPFDAIKKYWI